MEGSISSTGLLQKAGGHGLTKEDEKHSRRSPRTALGRFSRSCFVKKLGKKKGYGKAAHGGGAPIAHKFGFRSKSRGRKEGKGCPLGGILFGINSTARRRWDETIWNRGRGKGCDKGVCGKTANGVKGPISPNWGHKEGTDHTKCNQPLRRGPLEACTGPRSPDPRKEEVERPMKEKRYNGNGIVLPTRGGVPQRRKGEARGVLSNPTFDGKKTENVRASCQ